MDDLINNEEQVEALSDFELRNISGGMPDPLSGMSYEKAWKIAKEQDAKIKENKLKESEYTGVRFMKAWASSNKDRKDYLDHKKEVDEYIQGGEILGGEALSNQI